jgi:hypothetical protein
MNRSPLRTLLTWFVALAGMGTAAPGPSQAESVIFDLNVDTTFGQLGGATFFGTLSADYKPGSGVDIDATLELVPPFEFTKDDVTATFNDGTIRIDLTGTPTVKIESSTADIVPLAPTPGPPGQILDPALQGLVWDYALQCLTDNKCGSHVHFTVTSIDDPNNPKPDPTFGPLPYSDKNNKVYALYVSVDIVNTETGARGTVGGTLRQVPDVPLPGAAWLMGSVFTGLYGFRAWWRRRAQA